jgi:hypothetical protein
MITKNTKDKCLKCQVCKNTNDIKKLQEEIVRLQNQINLIAQISGENVNLGSPENPINNIFVSNIVNNDLSLKGINFDDTTSALVPSFDSFPKNWLTTNIFISSFRTYHYDLNTPNWIKWGVQNNLEVMIGITLGNYQNELDRLSNDYLSADTTLKSQYDINVIAIGVGNEEPVSKISLINEGLIYAKNLLQTNKLPKNSKITTVLTNAASDWIVSTYPPMNARFTENFLDLYPNIDIICFNLYDGYSNPELPLEVRLSWDNSTPSVTLNGFGAIRFAIDAAIKTIPNFTNKPFWCTEVGWQSSGDIPGSTVENLKTFYTNFLLFNMSNSYIPQESTRAVIPPDRIFYFTIRDANNEFFGLYSGNSVLTPKFT